MPSDDFVQLTKDEEELVEYAREGDGFIKEAWNRYGEDWPAYVPDNINAFMLYFFNMILLRHQLACYYCPIVDMMIHGGRFSGKTEALANMNTAWVTLHPGNDWLHVSPSLDQSIISYNAIVHWGQSGKFWDIFVRHSRTAPVPTIMIRKWDQYDPGSTIQFRSVGQQPAELLRSFEAGLVSGDEAFRNYPTDGPYRILAGMARGPNKYNLAKHPELKTRYDELAFGVATEIDPVKKKQLQREMDTFAEEYGLSKDIRFMLYGNVGAYTWEWQRFDYGIKNPGKRWSVTWTSDDNPYVTERQRELLAQQYRDDPHGLDVEMRAQRPVAVGDVFTGEHLQLLFDGQLDEEAIMAAGNDLAGWRWEMHPDFGLVWYMRPYESGGVYAAGGDPGAGRVPARNKWVNMVFRIDKRPFELVYMHTGNLGREGQGSIDPWIFDTKRILATYRIPENHFAAEAGGPQKNVHQVVWPEDLRIIPLTMQTVKATLIMQAQLMLRRGILVSPNIALLEQEMLGYQLDDKKLSQDFVMALLAVGYVVWPYVAEEFVTVDYEEEYEEAEAVAGGRDIRCASRDVRASR